jgi:hypothetical protein
MNSTQRKFLVDKMTEVAKGKITALRNSKPDRANINVFMLHKVLSNDFDIKSKEELKKIILDKALKAGTNKNTREDWLGNSWNVANRTGVHFTFSEFFIVPEEYKQMIADSEKEISRIEKEIFDLQTVVDTLEVRIMVASDSKLDKLINDIDDMGDISLIDTKIKLLK